MFIPILIVSAFLPLTFLCVKYIVNFFIDSNYFWKSYLSAMVIWIIGIFILTSIGYDVEVLSTGHPLGILLFLLSIIPLQYETKKKYNKFNVIDTILMLISIPIGFLISGFSLMMLLGFIIWG